MKLDKNIIYAIPFLLLLLMEELFQPFDYKSTVGQFNAYTQFLYYFGKVVPLVCFTYLIFKFQKFNPFILLVYSLVVAYFVFMVFESLYLYNSPMKFPHVILKILDVFLILAFFAYYQEHPDAKLSLAMNLIILGIFMKIAINPSMISVNAFVTHDRGLPAPTVYLLSLPCLYFFNKYAVELKFSAFIKFLMFFLFIIFFNHRTVWVTITFSLLLNIYMLRNNKSFKMKKMLQSFVIIGLVGLLGISFIASYFPDIIVKINENINNITNPNEDSTGSWRMLQAESYWPFIKEHFVEGMRWKGFELPIQFYNPDAGIPYFEDGGGHHFHSFYVDRLFYFGLLGLVLFLMLMIYPVYLVLKYKIELNNIQISFFIFSVSGIVFGISYNLPSFYWIIVGVTIAYLETKKKKYHQVENFKAVSALNG